MTQLTAKSGASKEDLIPEAMMWIKDAPLFIDEQNLANFYDAAVRPAFEEVGPREISVSVEKQNKLKGAIKASAGLHLPSWFAQIISAEVKVEPEASGEHSNQDKNSTKIQLMAVTTPQRQLEQLAAFYFLERDDRILYGTTESPLKWQADGIAKKVPRALVFLDLEPGTKLIPMAVEFSNGSVVTLFDKMSASNGENPPKSFSRDSQCEYWSWYDKNFDAGKAVEIIEAAAAEQQSKIQWIDFRIPLDDRVTTMHVNFVPDGKFSTGTFAYRLVRRAEGHGIRLVGTLKDGPDINVLAVYEK